MRVIIAAAPIIYTRHDYKTDNVMFSYTDPSSPSSNTQQQLHHDEKFTPRESRKVVALEPSPALLFKNSPFPLGERGGNQSRRQKTLVSASASSR